MKVALNVIFISFEAIFASSNVKVIFITPFIDFIKVIISYF